MLQMIIKKDGKQITKTWVKLTEIAALLKKYDADEIAFRQPEVTVLDLQAEEAIGKKDHV